MILRGENAGKDGSRLVGDNNVRSYSRFPLTLYKCAGNDVKSLGIVLLIKAMEAWNGEHG